MIGGYAENKQVDLDAEWPETKAAAAVIERRCAACHQGPQRLLPRSLSDERGLSFWKPDPDDPRLNTSRHIVFNLSRPEKSLFLLAPLAASAGGWGLCHAADASPGSGVLSGRDEPDYQTLLAFCAAGSGRMAEIKRFDMPDFRPRVDWVREMKRYGVLPASLKPDEPLDVYAVEEKYWRSLWYEPAGN
jgi:hypothetical protein